MNKYIATILISSLLLPTSFAVTGEILLDLWGNPSTAEKTTTGDVWASKELKVTENKIIDVWKNKIPFTSTVLNDPTIREKELQLVTLQSDIAKYEQELSNLNENINTLSSHVKLLETSLSISALRIQAVKIQVAQKEQQIKEQYEKLHIVQVAEEYQAGALSEFVSLLYKQDQLYFSRGDGFFSDLTLLVSPVSFSDILTRRKYIENLKDTGVGILKDLQDVENVLSMQKTQLEEDQKELTILKDQLIGEETSLSEQKQSKEALLTDTKGREDAYQVLLSSSVKDYYSVENEVTLIHSNLKDIQGQIEAMQSGLSGQLTPEEIAKRMELLRSLGVSSTGKLGLDWPVYPGKGISAFFRDGGYKKHFGVNHNAIDIPTPMRTPILSPADGYVTKVRDNGLGYSYIVVAHAGGIMTVYGHVYSILVNAGDFVGRGTPIGLTGGAPGTKGAGWMTTGAHLHFEVLQDGKHVNPLGFLDNSYLTK